MRSLFAAALVLLGCGTKVVIVEVEKGPDTGVVIEDSAITDGVVSDTTTPVTDTMVDTTVEPDVGKVTCPAGTSTTISGTVYAPNGKTALYNALVYVPIGAVPPIPKGATCDRCGTAPASKASAIALSDARGKFVLNDVPVGAATPVVIQVGKWRKQLTIGTTACKDTPITDAALTKLPSKQSEGDMPRIAITVGACDKLACMLPKIGIDASEYGVDGSDKAVHFYAPGGVGTGPAGMKDARTLWSNAAKLKEYDLAVFSCECSERPDTKDAASFAAVADYLNLGGRILTSDFQYLWYKSSPDTAMKGAMSIPGGAPTGGSPVNVSILLPKAKALSTWLTAVDATFTGGVKPDYVFNNIEKATDSVGVFGTSAGGTGPAGATENPRFVAVNTPVGKPSGEQCGRAIHLDAHINQTETVDASFPAGCKAGEINAGQAAFSFFFFDLLGCVQSDKTDPVVPPMK